MLTDAKIRNANPKQGPVKLTDSGGLYLEVRPSGSKLWRYRYRIAKKENIFAIGEYPQISLSEAREKRNEARALVKQGIHPSHHRQSQKIVQITANANTFEAIAQEWIEQNKTRWSPYYSSQIQKVLKADAFPQIGSLPIQSITSAHLLKIIQKVAKRGAETVAILMRQWFSAIFRYAVVTLRADNDPAAAIKGAIERPPTQHRKPLTRKDIPGFFKALEAYGGYRTTTIAMHLSMLTFVRPGEMRKAEWEEFDLDNAEWRIPEVHTKMRDLHLVPLSRQAIKLLRELHTLTGGQRLLFPNYRRPKTYMTNTTLNRSLERMGYAGKFSSHGFRATASTMLNEMNFRPDVIERQLAHKERNKSRASYNRAEYLPERREMMQAWSDLIDSMATGESKVTPIKRRNTA